MAQGKVQCAVLSMRPGRTGAEGVVARAFPLAAQLGKLFLQVGRVARRSS
ncbi:MAG: hypothetical protein ACE149_16835 [Armatimonadota bacterium]